MPKKWKTFEKKIAKEFGGRVQPGSGNQWYSPSDVTTDDFLFECKQTEKKSYSISLLTWDKLYSQALFSYKIPVLSLQIQETDLVILDKQDFLNILKAT